MGLLLAVVKPQAAASKEVNAVARPRNTAGGQECFRGVPRGPSEFMERFSQGYPKVLGAESGRVETEARSVQDVGGTVGCSDKTEQHLANWPD